METRGPPEQACDRCLWAMPLAPAARMMTGLRGPVMNRQILVTLLAAAISRACPSMPKPEISVQACASVASIALQAALFNVSMLTIAPSM